MRAKFVRGQDPKDAMGLGLANEIAERTSNAYSFDRYGEKEWRAIASFLLQKGIDEDMVEWVLRSKHMRWAADHMPEFDEDIGVLGFVNYYDRNANKLRQDIGNRDLLKEMDGGATGGVSSPGATLANTPGMGNAQPASSASTGSLDGAPMGSGDKWDASTGIKMAVQENLNEMNINPHDKLGVAMAKKMGIEIPFKKGKGDKDVEQKIIDEDIDLSTKLMSFEEWAKKFNEK